MKNIDDITAFDYYIYDVRKTDMLSREEEIQLAERIADGDLAARDKLVTSNLRFVIKTAQEFTGMGLDLDDLVNEGNIGLITAAEKFDASKGVRFTTYAAFWIKQAIRKAIADQSRTIRLPVNKHDAILNVRKAIAKLKSSCKAVTVSSIAEVCGMKPEAVKDILTLDKGMTSLDTPVGDGEDPDCLGDFIPSDAAMPEDLLMDKVFRETVSGAVDSLDDREREIIMRRNGFGGYEEQSLQEIGDAIGLTKERVRQIEKKAKEKLSLNEGLAAYAA